MSKPADLKPSARTVTEICPDRLYPLPRFKLCSGLGDEALTEARRAGLKIRYLHRRAYVLGRDFIEYVERCATDRP